MAQAQSVKLLGVRKARNSHRAPKSPLVGSNSSPLGGIGVDPKLSPSQVFNFVWGNYKSSLGSLAPSSQASPSQNLLTKQPLS